MKKFLILAFLFFSDLAFGQVTFLPTTVAFPQIAVGGDPGDQNYVTLVQMVNGNSANINGHLAIFGDNGAALPVLIDGAGPMSSIDIPLVPGQARQVALTMSGGVTPGWLQITYSPSDALTTVILQYRSGSTLLSEVGVAPAFNSISATDFATQTGPTLNTGIALANPGTTAASVLATLWDPSAGTMLSGTAVSLPPNGHVARFLSELFPNVANINQISAQLSLDSCSDSTCNFPGGPGFIATAVRLNGNQYTTIPIVQRMSTGNQIRVLPQVAFGGPSDGVNMDTVLSLTTDLNTGVFGTGDIFDNNGNPLVASVNGAAASSTFTFTVSGNRVTQLVLSGDQTLRSGWIRLTLSGTVNFTVNALFQTYIGPNLDSEASVLESDPSTRGLIYVKTQAGLADVGIALSNPQSTQNTVNLKLFNQDGYLINNKDVTLQANGHLAEFATELFPELMGLNFDGALSMSSPTPFSALALRLSADKIATLPVASDGMYRPSITGLRVTGTQRSPAQVNFSIDVTDFDSDVAISGVPSVSAIGYLDFGSLGFDYGPFTINGNALINQSSGTITGGFVPPDITGAVPSGTTATFYIQVFDQPGNESNIVGLPIRF